MDRRPKRMIQLGIPIDDNECLAAGAERNGVPVAALARAALLRGLPGELDYRRARRRREGRSGDGS